VALGPRASQAASLAGLWSTPSLNFPLSPPGCSSSDHHLPIGLYRHTRTKTLFCGAVASLLVMRSGVHGPIARYRREYDPSHIADIFYFLDIIFY